MTTTPLPSETTKAQGISPDHGRLALHGGPQAVTVPLAPVRRWGVKELAQLEEMLEQSSLFYWNGPQTELLVKRFQEHYPLEHVMPCSSGTAALHIAVAAAGVGLGDEVITAPITDMGTVIGILYQGGVPVFADLDPGTYNMSPESVAEKITAKTKAVLVVHLAGNPCRLDELKALCDEHDLVLIEDCAQAWGAQYRGLPIGTIGHIGCWSLNDFKHIGCGDGGIVASNDARFGPLLQSFGDKAYDRKSGGRRPEVLAPNYRISEPQSAIAAAQMTKMWDVTAKRAGVGRLFNELLCNVPGVVIPKIDDRDRWTAWFYMFRIDPNILSCTHAEFAEAMQAEGMPAGAGYIGVPLYQYPLFQTENFLAGRWPAKEMGLTDMDYKTVRCPNAEAILGTCISFGTSTGMTDEWVRQAAEAIAKVANYFIRR